jgi:hypothetical protein
MTRTSFPPGVGPAGVTDAELLAEIHARLLSGHSYRMDIVHREYVDGRLRGVARERVTVASPRHYRSSVRTFGTVEYSSMTVSGVSTYANGTVRYIRRADDRGAGETTYRRQLIPESDDPNRFVERSSRYVQWYLEVEESRIVGHTTHNGTTQFLISTTGDPWLGVTNARGEARIGEWGLVRSLSREYRPASDQAVRIVATIRIAPGPVTVTRPAWTDGENETATTPSSPPASPRLTAVTPPMAAGTPGTDPSRPDGRRG